MALLADQGAVSAGNSVASWGGDMGEIGIDMTTTANVAAPAAVWVEAINPSGFSLSTAPAGTPYDPAFHEITYIWTVRGAPLVAFAAPERLVTQHNNPNVMYGKRAAFSFPNPGSYDIDLWCIDANGVTATATTSVTVVDPDTVADWFGTRTICFSVAGDFTGKPTGAREVTTQAALEAAVGGVTQCRILFRRGEEFSLDRVGFSKMQYVGGFGSGNRPVLRPNRGLNDGLFVNPTNSGEITVTGLDFRGDWDAATETGWDCETPFLHLGRSEVCQFHYHDVHVDGFAKWSVELNSQTGAAGSRGVYSDCSISNWRDYGFFSNILLTDKYLALIGCRAAQNVDALNGNPTANNKNGFHNDHGAVRIALTRNTIISQCDLFSRNGWSGLTPDNADQPCIRLNSNLNTGTMDAADRLLNTAIIERCTMEGGWRVLALEGQNTGEVEYPGNYLVERNLMIGSSRTIQNFIQLEFGGTTIRNNIGVMPNMPEYHGIFSWFAAINLQMDQVTTVNADTPIQVHSNTWLNLRNATNDDGDTWAVLNDGASVFNDKTVENNVVHAPGIDAPVNGDAPLDIATAIAGVAPRFKGVLFGFGIEESTLGADVPDGSTVTMAYPPGTDQAYWQAIEATDTRHTIRIGGLTNGTFYAHYNEFSVTFGASGVTITNTSGATWPSGGFLRVKLDRTSLLGTIDTTYASPSTLPLPRPQTGSAAIGSGDLGRRAYDDFMGSVRPQTGNTRGALVPG